MLRRAKQTKRQIIEQLNKRLLGEQDDIDMLAGNDVDIVEQDDLYRHEGGNIKGMIEELEKCIGYGMDGTDEECVYKFLETHTWEDLLAMDKYFKSKEFVDTVGYIMGDFKEPYGNKEERKKVMELIIKLMEASSKNPVNDDRYMYYFSQRHGIEDAGIE